MLASGSNGRLSDYELTLRTMGGRCLANVDANPTTKELGKYKREDLEVELAYERDFEFMENRWTKLADFLYKSITRKKERTHLCRTEVPGHLHGIPAAVKLSVSKSKKYAGLKQIEFCTDLPDSDVYFNPRYSRAERSFLGLNPNIEPTIDELKRIALTYNVRYTKFNKVSPTATISYIRDTKLVPKSSFQLSFLCYFAIL